MQPWRSSASNWSSGRSTLRVGRGAGRAGKQRSAFSDHSQCLDASHASASNFIQWNFGKRASAVANKIAMIAKKMVNKESLFIFFC